MVLKFKLGFFLHIPFPSWDIFRLFPWADQILQGLLGCDMVGFHIKDYCINFLDCCCRSLGCRVDRKKFIVEYGNRIVRVRSMPIGIPFDRFVEMAQRSAPVLNSQLQMVLSVDRLDYTKGIVQRLKAFELLLERYPQYKDKVLLMQISVPSRTNIKEYQDLKEEIDQLVGRINGRYSSPNWSPIRYIYGCVSQKNLTAFYRDSAVAMVTPIKDGMNLVAKEFVACQIKKIPGVLILSPFAGTSETMQEALICNPFDLLDVTDTLHRALTMSDDEKILRMSGLRHREKNNDVDFWMRSFLEEMNTIIIEDGNNVLPTIMQPLTLQDFEDSLSKYIGDTRKLALLLDYDGTLAPFVLRPNLAVLPPETKSILERLSIIPDVYIYIISDRNVYNLKEMVGIESFTYVGYHGMDILRPDGSKFSYPVPVEYKKKVEALAIILRRQACKYGAWLETKSFLLTYHFRGVPPEYRPEILVTAKRVILEAGFKLIQADCTLEAKPPVQWDTGRACLHIINTDFGLKWSENIRIIYAGDDITDEDAMKSLKGMAATFRVTQSHVVKTSAARRLPNTESVLTMLKWIENHFNKRISHQD
ncbi:alpha,alpha-trehalose-phosphate synthase [UDP-forming] 2-like [Sipha flava]|uniref:Alpha,alpha-trehalose-phosphate synthase [UDP-forming] 2-like n=1 Tax=Sipha flava TaxID=143950 RepID=A0A8B8F9N8_9HEMI|nr:alpha,alpha-trehalose-phosphate synthase [UDP-forming] 2-like [Sipha flava]